MGRFPDLRGRRILIVTPAPPGSRKGNRITAERWARLLRGARARVHIACAYYGQACDVLIALHASRSADSIARFRRARPHALLIVLLTGTDMIGRSRAKALRSMALADRLVALHGLAWQFVPPRFRKRLRVVCQSAEAPRGAGRRDRRSFVAAVVGHLRAIKDPFRAALAARRLPPDSRVRILQVGRALTPRMELRARREERENPRYRWIGEVSHGQAIRIIARAHVVVVSSRHEGGPNVISEAVACGTPVLATRIPGNVGLLGRDYPGYFRPGDTSALARLLRRLETDGEFYTLLAQRIRAIASRFRPECERDRLVRVILEVAG